MKKENKSIPKKLEGVFEEVRSQIILLHGWWDIYRQLFGTSRERIDLLNESASTFFRIVQDTLWDGIQLMIIKLSEPAQTRRKKNLSLALICKIVKELGQKELYSSLIKSLSLFIKKSEAFKKHRNKRIVHFDLDTFINERIKHLPGISRKMIEDALVELRFFMNLVDGFYKGNEMAYDFSFTRDDGEMLIHILKEGLRYVELSRERKIDIMDLEKSKYYKV